MNHNTTPDVFADSASFDKKEEIMIERQVEFELNEMQLIMTKVGAITNIIGGLLVIWLLYNEVQFGYLIFWYIIFVIVNVINIIFSLTFQYCKVTPDKIDSWLKAYHYLIMPPVCLAWSSIGILSLPADVPHQFYIITLLLAVLISFSLATISDFTASAISIVCILMPTFLVRTYLGIESIVISHSLHNLNLGIGICLLILGIFLLITCFIGYMLIKKSIKLTYINIALNKKLENMNKFLEQRVKERTQELEKSLNLVTYQATHDLLTDLPNQRLLNQFLQTTISEANTRQHMIAVVCFSLNEIDRINNSLGHQVGDKVIQTIAHRMNSMVELHLNNQTHYQVTQLRKDVFVILIEPITKFEEVESKVHAVFSIIEDPIILDQYVFKITACMGVSVYPRDGNLHALLMNADAAMLEAKQQGGNAIHIYESKINKDVYKELQLEGNLHKAVKEGEFFLLYQPIIDLKAKKIIGSEALIRWKHPEYGLISPAVFIPLAEANGLILPLGEWALRTACKELAAWHRQGFVNLKVSVNLSAKQLNQKNMAQVIADVLHQTRVKAEFLELELTESEAFKEDVIPVIQEFKALGVSLVIDDFGTGYSGLSNIKQISIDKLKIDRSFIQDLETNRGSQAIVANIISLGKSIHIQVLAEGVENKSQLDILQEYGCDYIQGYYFSPPVDGEVMLQLLKGERSLLYGNKSEY